MNPARANSFLGVCTRAAPLFYKEKILLTKIIRAFRRSPLLIPNYFLLALSLLVDFKAIGWEPGVSDILIFATVFVLHFAFLTYSKIGFGVLESVFASELESLINAILLFSTIWALAFSASGSIGISTIVGVVVSGILIFVRLNEFKSYGRERKKWHGRVEFTEIAVVYAMYILTMLVISRTVIVLPLICLLLLPIHAFFYTEKEKDWPVSILQNLSSALIVGTVIAYILVHALF